MAGGRPTEYNPDYVQRTLEYAENYATFGDCVPSIEGLACELKVSVASIYNWEKDPEKKQFLEALNYLRAKQARECINKGLDSSFNSAITKLILHNHGYSDKQAVDHGSSDGSMSLASLINQKKNDK